MLYDIRHIIHCFLVSVSLKLLVPTVPQVIITMTDPYQNLKKCWSLQKEVT